MFNIFKKQPTVTVEEIHNEFNTAADNLLLQAKKVIAEAEANDLSKISRLESLGFKNSSQVKKAKPALEKARLSNTLVDLIKYYQAKYPLNKFITEGQVKTICEKYNLVCGPVTSYLGFVPEKNLKQVEAFNVFDSDKQNPYITNVRIEYTLQDNIFNQLLLDYPDGKFPVSIVSPGDNAHIIYGNEKIWLSKYDLIKQDSLMICAPLKEMNTKGLKQKGFMLLKSTRIHVPDPVVLQPVKGGYLIVTAWGDEASDPIVVNPIQN